MNRDTHLLFVFGIVALEHEFLFVSDGLPFAFLRLALLLQERFAEFGPVQRHVGLEIRLGDFADGIGDAGCDRNLQDGQQTCGDLARETVSSTGMP